VLGYGVRSWRSLEIERWRATPWPRPSRRRSAARAISATRNVGSGGRRIADQSYEMEEPPATLVAGLARLSPNQRAALVLHYYAGYPTKEIAGIIGSSPATVRVHLSQGRKRLRRILEEPDD
jgi:RNA polymerase sigma factor (sigma-70 family)